MIITRHIIFLGLLLIIGCEKSYSNPIELLIINSSNVWGETEPCG